MSRGGFFPPRFPITGQCIPGAAGLAGTTAAPLRLTRALGRLEAVAGSRSGVRALCALPFSSQAFSWSESFGVKEAQSFRLGSSGVLTYLTPDGTAPPQKALGNTRDLIIHSVFLLSLPGIHQAESPFLRVGPGGDKEMPFRSSLSHAVGVVGVSS